MCRLKLAELAKQHLKYEGRLVLQGDNEEDHVIRAVFTEQALQLLKVGSSKSSGRRLPGMASKATTQSQRTK